MNTQTSNGSLTSPGRGVSAYFAGGIAALGGLLFGFDTGVISGAELFLKNDFALSTFDLEVIVSGVLVGAAAGALSGGRLADLFGRRKLLIVTAIIFAAGAIVCAGAQSPAMLIAGRIVVGVGIGLSSGTVPVYISEISSAEARGWQVSLFQLAITIGIFLAYVVAYAFAASHAWRWMFGVAVLPAAVFAVGILYLPESPRWLIRQGRMKEAREVLMRMQGKSEADSEIHDVESSLSRAEESGAMSDLLEKSMRLPLVVGIGLAIFQQITGINTVIYYAPLIVQSAGISSNSGALLATIGIGLVNILTTVVAMWLIDRVGRRPLLLIGIAGMIATLGSLGYIFQSSNKSNPDLAWAAVISLMLYVASFAISLGPIFWLMISEIYPLRIRSSTEGLAAAFNWGSNLLVSLTFLTLLQIAGTSRTFWLYGCLAVAAWLFCYYLVPETKGRSLEQIEEFWRRGRKQSGK